MDQERHDGPGAPGVERVRVPWIQGTGARQTGLRFAIVGSANTLIDLVLFGILATLGVPVVAANFFSTAAGMSFSFLANRRFTFRSRVSVRRSLGPFFVITAFGLWVVHPIVILAVAALLTGLGWHGSIAEIWIPKIAAIGVGMVWNFTLYRYVVFRERRGKA